MTVKQTLCTDGKQIILIRIVAVDPLNIGRKHSFLLTTANGYVCPRAIQIRSYHSVTISPIDGVSYTLYITGSIQNKGVRV